MKTTWIWASRYGNSLLCPARLRKSFIYNGLSVNVGYVSFQDEGIGSNAIGLLLAYDFDLRIH